MTETQYEYPFTPRRSWINLAEGIRVLDDDHTDLLNEAINNLPMPEGERADVRTVMLNTLGEFGSNRERLAQALAAVLTGREKFDAARFIHHATSDSDADDDGEGGKWSYNRTNPDDAMKTTIEGGDETVTL